MLVQPLSGERSIGEAIAAELTDCLQHSQTGSPMRLHIEERERCFEDSRIHIGYLLEAVDQRRPQIYSSYLSWAKSLHMHRGGEEAYFSNQITLLHNVINQRFAGTIRETAISTIESAVASLPSLPAQERSYIVDGDPLSELARSYLSAVVERRRGDARNMIKAAAKDMAAVRDVYLNVLQPVLREVGRLWHMGRISVADEHYSTAVTQFIMSELYPYVISKRRCGRNFVAACVGDELHEIGVRMVADIMEMEGWDTIYLGSNLPAPEIAEAVIRSKAHVVGLSVTMPFYANRAKETVNLLRTDKRAAGIQIAIGGYAFGEGGCDWKITGADIFAADAAEVARILTQDRQSG